MPELLGMTRAASGSHLRRQAAGGRRVEQAPVVSDTKQLYLQFVRFLSRENVQTKWTKIVLSSIEIGSAHESFPRRIGRGATNPEVFSIGQEWIEGPVERPDDADWFRFSAAGAEALTVTVKPIGDLISRLAAPSTGKRIYATEQPNTLRAIRLFSAGGQKSVVRFLKRLKTKHLSDEARQAVFEAFSDAITAELQRLTSDFEKQATSARTESFILRAQRLDNHERTDAALDLIYDSIDDLMRNEQVQRLDSILASIPITDLSTEILLGILTATLPAKSRLPMRAGFFNAVEQTIRQRGEYEEGLLTGLQS